MTMWYSGRNGQVAGSKPRQLTDKEIKAEMDHKVKGARQKGWSEQHISEVLKPKWLEKLGAGDEPSEDAESESAD